MESVQDTNLKNHYPSATVLLLAILLKSMEPWIISNLPSLFCLLCYSVFGKRGSSL